MYITLEVWRFVALLILCGGLGMLARWLVFGKKKGKQLEKERQLIAESRALLTAYDDFMFGLKSNQYLYNKQEHMYSQRVAQLQASYENAVKYVLMTAQAQGVALDLPEAKFIGAKSNE